MNITEKRTETIINYLFDDERNEHVEFCSEYGEPSYTDPEKGILFANWNNISDFAQEYLEAAGYELEWSDEWIIDYDSNKAYRTNPTHYGWEPSFILIHGDVVGFDEDNMDEIIDELLIRYHYETNNMTPLPSNALNVSDLEERGYTLCAEYECSWNLDESGTLIEDVKRIVKDDKFCLLRRSGQGQFGCSVQLFYIEDD